MGGMNSVRNKKIDKYVKEGMTEDEAIMRADEESQVRTEKQNPATKKVLSDLGTNAADVEKVMMDKNVKRTGEKDWPNGTKPKPKTTTKEKTAFEDITGMSPDWIEKLKGKVGSKKKYPSNLELLMYGKDWYDKKGKFLPKGK